MIDLSNTVSGLKTPAIGAPTAIPAALSKRDYILLPLLSLVTMIALFLSTELLTRALWPAHDDESCIVENPITGNRAKPNCTQRSKNPEGPWVTYHYNECGYRTPDSCQVKPGILRIALLGSSVTEGFRVPEDQTFAERSARALSRIVGQHVEVQNLSIEALTPVQCSLRLNEALALRPNSVVYALNSYDLDNQLGLINSLSENPAAVTPKPNINKQLKNLLHESRTFTVAQHFLFAHPATYIQKYMKQQDKADYLRKPLTPAWQSRYSALKLIIDDMAARSRAANVPFLLMAIPTHAQMCLLSAPDPSPSVDPFSFNRNLAEIAAGAHIEYLDTINDFSRVTDSPSLFFPVDSHPTPEAHQILADALVRKCLQSKLFLSKKQNQTTQAPH